VKITEWPSSLDRSDQKDSNEIYFPFLRFLKILTNFGSLNKFFELFKSPGGLLGSACQNPKWALVPSPSHTVKNRPRARCGVVSTSAPGTRGGAAVDDEPGDVV
jgi:hypothetical protein